MYVCVSKSFKIAVKMADVPSWKIAVKAMVHPNVLSKIMSGAVPIRKDDPRVLRVAKVLGLSETECFEVSEGGEHNAE